MDARRRRRAGAPAGRGGGTGRESGGVRIPINQDRLNRLQDLGLTEYQARAYLALLDLGTAPAKDVAALSRVPKSKIYSTLDQLHDKGLVTIVPEHPKRYRVLPIESYIGDLKADYRERLERLHEKEDELVAEFGPTGDVELEDTGSFSVIKGRRNVVGKMFEMVKAARRDVFIVGTEASGRRVRHYHEELQEARERGADVRLLCPVSPGNLEALREVSDAVEARHRSPAMGALGPGAEGRGAGVVLNVVDGEAAMLVHYVPDDVHFYQGDDVAIWTNDAALVGAIQAMAEAFWGQAPSLEEVAPVVEGGRTPGAIGIQRPRERTPLRQALEAAGEGVDVLFAPGEWEASAPWLLPHLRDLLERDVRVRLVVAPGEGDAGDLESIVAAGGAVRRGAPGNLANLWLLDGADARVQLATEPPAELDATEAPLVDALAGAFEAAWRESVPLAPGEGDAHLLSESARRTLARHGDEPTPFLRTVLEAAGAALPVLPWQEARLRALGREAGRAAAPRFPQGDREALFREVQAFLARLGAGELVVEPGAEAPRMRIELREAGRGAPEGGAAAWAALLEGVVSAVVEDRLGVRVEPEAAGERGAASSRPLRIREGGHSR